MAGRPRKPKNGPDDPTLFVTMSPPARPKRIPGRVERALNEELRKMSGDNDVPAGARAALRVAAHLLDLADERGDVEAGAKILPRLLELRVAYGMAGSVGGPLDPFAAFVAGMSAPTLRNPEDTDTG